MALIIPKGNKQPAPASQPVVAPEPQPQQPVISTSTSPANANNSGNQLDFLIESQLQNLIQKLESSIPDIRTELITIHKAIAKDPAQVTILSQEQRAALFASYSKLSGVELVAKAASKKGSKQPVSLDMFE